MIREAGNAVVGIVPHLENLMASGSAVPLAVATLVIYVLTIGRHG